MELLDEVSVIPYLIEQGIVEEGQEISIEVLTGGVSNTVMAITTGEDKWVLKQALPALKVAEKWEADQRRAVVEANALELFHELSPNEVPKLVFIDPVGFVLIMERAPSDCSIWKTDLLSGVYNVDVARTLGRTLATWHRFGEVNTSQRIRFKEHVLFNQLRVDPFYRFVANRNPLLRESIGKLIAELESDHSTLVHGDFSPKNILVSPLGQVYILDFETLHVGNPVFDLAFLLAHLVCKFFRVGDKLDRLALANLASEFVAEYEKLHPISGSLALHTALITLARVEGKSPVNYLNPAQQESLQAFTKSILSKKTSTYILDLFQLDAP